jgi:hypothetical protein
MTWNRIALVAVGLFAAALVAGLLREDLRLLVGAVAGLGAIGWLWIKRWRQRRRRAARRPPPREHIPRAIRRRVYARDGYACRYCRRKRSHVVRLELDHFVPVAHGGTDDPGNLVTACFDCNRAKGAKLLPDDGALRRFIAEREAAVAAMTRADWRRVLWRDLLVTALILVVVIATYVALTRYVI